MSPFVIVILSASIVLGIIVLFAAVNHRERLRAKEARRMWIYAKYGHSDIAERILNQTAWVGQTSEQLKDSMGPPVDIDEKVLKTKKKEVWKYIHKGGNRYGLRFTLENDSVIGWDEKL